MEKILYIGSDGMPSGSANNLQIVNMCQAFADHGLDVHLLTFNSKKHQSGFQSRIFDIFPQLETQQKIKVESYFVPRIYRINNYIKRLLLRQKIRKFKPDVIFSRIPSYINMVSDYGIFTILESHNPLSENQCRILERIDLHLVISPFLIESVSKCCGKHLNAIFISNGISEIFLKELNEKFPFSYYSANNKKNVLYCGTIGPHRGLEETLKVAKRLINVNFFFAGPIKSESYYDALLQKFSLDNVYYLGAFKQKDVPKLYAAADLILMNYNSTIPVAKYIYNLKLFELIASSKPFIFTNLEGYSRIELLKRFDEFKIEPDEPDLLEKKIVQLLSGDYDLNLLDNKSLVKNKTWKERARKILSYKEDKLS